ncbi:hypothetical protein PILCRDRAFT_810470 [Piloderma croceum F 1598]|uniref:Uncharacterized protein n=1 Tax=Piloderma croceum (strain F 1598) TaxID=765440 RepID=A0A0C3G857_PILCF|nr:hypothetical protein PILCRDRAFT_810470 [Piloderma croceum F 1598]
MAEAIKLGLLEVYWDNQFYVHLALRLLSTTQSSTRSCQAHNHSLWARHMYNGHHHASWCLLQSTTIIHAIKSHFPIIASAEGSAPT